MRSFVMLTIWTILAAGSLCAADITAWDLEGFDYTRQILAYKDIKLPDPTPPEHGGITSGAVFVLGKYLPPPYEVSVEGVHVMINGVPCTYLERLIETDEERERIRHSEIAGPTEMKLLDIYQRTKWYEGPAAARKKLENYLANLKGFDLLGLETRPVDPEKIFVMKLKVSESEIKEIKVKLSESEKSGKGLDWWIHHCEKTNEGHLRGQTKQECLGYEIIEEKVPGPEERLVVRLSQKELGEFEVEVDGPDAERGWIRSFGENSILDKTYEMLEKYPQDKNRVVNEVTEFARKQPWVTSFEMDRETIGFWHLNGEYSPNLLGRRVTDYKLLTRVDENERANYYARESAAPQIRKALLSNSIIFFIGSKIYGKNNTELVGYIKKTLESSLSRKKKRDELYTYFIKNDIVYGKSNAHKVASFLAALYLEPDATK